MVGRKLDHQLAIKILLTVKNARCFVHRPGGRQAQIRAGAFHVHPADGRAVHAGADIGRQPRCQPTFAGGEQQENRAAHSIAPVLNTTFTASLRCRSSPASETSANTSPSRTIASARTRSPSWAWTNIRACRPS